MKIPAIKNGIRSFTTDSIEHFAIFQEMKSVVPTGGVNRPMASAQRHTIAIWIGSIPMLAAMGM